MNIAAIQRLRRRLAEDQTVFGMWVTLDSPTVSDIASAVGLDWIVIDAEHGSLDWKEIAQHIRATVRSETVTLVRIAELNIGLVKRALDLGADGVVVPWVESVDKLARAVSYAKYPLEGVRGIGAERATAWGQALSEHTREANDHVLVVPIIETVGTRPNVAEMARVPGVELFFFGPADYSSTAGFRGEWEGPGVAEQILDMKTELRRVGKHCGVVATSIANVQERIQQGFRMIGLGMDVGLLIRSLRESLASVDRGQSIRASLIPPS